MLIPLFTLISKYGIKPTGILHLGANLAQEAPMYRACGVHKMIFVEALPDIYEQMLDRIKDYPQAIGVNACVSDVSLEKVVFHVANNEGQSSSFYDFGTHSQHHPTVKFISDIEMFTIRVDEMGLDLLGVNMLIMDIQGAEGKALTGIGKLIERFDYVYSEVNNDEVYVGCAKIWELDEYLSQYGFERVETQWAGKTGWGDAIWIKK